jgi:hypothetical protein
VLLLSAGALALGSGTAVAGTDDVQPGPEYTAFEPGPDYTAFEPGPDYSIFEPGASPGTAELVDDNAARVLGSVLGGLFG